jgi:stage II sporulation protein D
MRKSGLLLSVLALVTSTLPTFAPSSAFADSLPTQAIPNDFRFFGSGYGHGVGMSQIGARGQALEGKSAVEILNYYYPGTSVTPYPDNQLIRVNIANLISSISLKAVGGVGELRLYKGDIPLNESPEPLGIYKGDTTALFTNFAGSVVPTLSSPTTKFAPFTPNNSWTLRWDIPSTTIEVTNQNLVNQYKYGQITIKSVSNAVSSYLAVTNTLRLHDEYLWGIGEVPSSWPAAALEAQAIAARTYALGKLSRIRVECDCNIYNSTVDQNFVGYSKEIEKIYGIKWKEAVNRTFIDQENAMVITFDGKPISAFYSSSTGGATQNVKDVWGSSIAYLQGVPDPWSLDTTINPRFAFWERVVTQRDIASAFALKDVVTYRIDSRSKTGSVMSITAASSDGRTATLTGELFRARTKLPSTWFKDPVNVPLISESAVCDNTMRFVKRFCYE